VQCGTQCFCARFIKNGGQIRKGFKLDSLQRRMYRLCMNEQYGPSLSTHRGTIGAGGWLWYVVGLLVLGIGASLVRAVSGLASPAAAAANADALPAALMCVCMLPFALAIPLLRWRQQLEIFQNGYVWTRLIGVKQGARGSIAKVTQVQHIGRSGNHIELRVELRSGGELSIAGVERADQAANLLANLTQVAPSGPPQPAWAPPQGGR
jgi:hypothetical protein